MIIIRNAQLEEFCRVSSVRFAMEMMSHLKLSEPALVATAGDDRAADFIQVGIGRANEHGFQSQSTIRFYLDMMATLGWDFDRDPQYPWARDILSDREGFSESEQADRLYFHLVNYLDRVNGPTGEYALEALHRCANIDFRKLFEIGSHHEAVGPAWLRSLFPRKCDYMGDAALDAMVRSVPGIAASNAFAQPEGVALLLGMMFTFGSGVLTDPLYIQICSPSEPEDPSERTTRIALRFRTYLRLMLRALEGAGNVKLS